MSKISTFNPEDLLKEKSLWQLYQLSWRFPVSKVNLGLAIACGLALIWTTYLNRSAPQVLLAQLRPLVEFGLSFSSSVLGFLIAGFTIFVTVTKMELFVEMAKKEFRATRLSYLKYNLITFIVVFIHFLAYALFLLLIKLFGASGGLLAQLIANQTMLIGESRNLLIVILVGGTLSFLGSWTIYVLMLLKSFVFNVYHIVVTMVLWEIKKPPQITNS